VIFFFIILIFPAKGTRALCRKIDGTGPLPEIQKKRRYHRVQAKEKSQYADRSLSRIQQGFQGYTSQCDGNDDGIDGDTGPSGVVDLGARRRHDSGTMKCNSHPIAAPRLHGDAPRTETEPCRRGPRRRGLWHLAGLTAALAAISALLVVFDVDRRVAAHFYDPGSGWPVGQSPLWLFLYRYGTMPGLALTLAALIGFGFSYRIRWLRPWRREFLLVFLTAVIGGGVLVNAFFKPYWGRPRPRQVAIYGGQYEYREFYSPGTPGKGQSFPCGHCTMGFVFVSLAVLRRRAPAAALAGAGFGAIYGSFLGLGRIVQGAHFVTDVLWSFGILALVAVVLHQFILPDADRLEAPIRRRHRRWAAALTAVLTVVIVLAFLTRRPFYETFSETVPVGPAVSRVEVLVEGPMEMGRIRIGKEGALGLHVQAQGFGWSMSGVSFGIVRRQEKGTLTILLQTKRTGYFSEFNQQVTVTTPRRYEGRLSIRPKEP
jgi:membrane-associated PAP2 superfamily phosphatase